MRGRHPVPRTRAPFPLAFSRSPREVHGPSIAFLAKRGHDEPETRREAGREHVYALSLGAIGFVAVGLTFLVAGVMRRRDSGTRRRCWIASAVTTVLAMLIVGSLAFAQEPVCRALGGDWVNARDACRREWGGNGSNDSSEPLISF
jgi:hypothetical protein